MAGHRSKAWIFGVAVALAVGGALFGGAKGLPAKAGPSCIGFSHGQYVSNVVFAGQVHVFEYNSCDSALEHDWFSGSWHSEILDGSGATPYSGNQTTNSVGKWNRSIVYGGQLHNFYYDDVAGSLRHAWWNGSTWHLEYLGGASATNGGTFDAVGGDSSAIVYNGQVHDFYIDHDAGSVRHAWWNGTAWHFEAVDGGGGVATGATGDSVGFYNSTVVYNGQLQLFTRDNTSDTLRHAWFSGTWHAELLDGQGSGYPGHSTGDVGEFSSALVFAGQLQDYYRDFPTSGSPTLREAFFNGAGWSFIDI